MNSTIGYAAGSTDAGEYLTVWGSAYRSDLIYATRDEAEERANVLRANTVESQQDRVIVRRVEASTFRILPEAEIVAEEVASLPRLRERLATLTRPQDEIWARDITRIIARIERDAAVQLSACEGCGAGVGEECFPFCMSAEVA